MELYSCRNKNTDHFSIVLLELSDNVLSFAFYKAVLH